MTPLNNPTLTLWPYRKGFRRLLQEARKQVRRAWIPALLAVFIAVVLCRYRISFAVIALAGLAVWAHARGYRLRLSRPGKPRRTH